MIFEIRKDGEFIGAFRIKDYEDFDLYEVVGDLEFDSITNDNGVIGTDEKKLVFEIKPLEEVVETMIKNPSKGLKLNEELGDL